MLGYKRVNKKADLPSAPHFAALVFSSIRVEGYDAGDYDYRAVVEYLAFESKAKMEEWVIKQETSSGSRESYHIIDCCPKQTKIAATVVIV